ncbi:MAG TPA: late competence development ComFB family protein [Patescibacteria group bacterium]|nr:late competence development ComFB family protein [Patescibacteria group bacterium]
MSLKNYMEEIVVHTLDQVLDKKPDVCRCEECRESMRALALNSLPPAYAVTQRGESFAKSKELDIQLNADVLAAVCRAMEIVSANPHFQKYANYHDKSSSDGER